MNLAHGFEPDAELWKRMEPHAPDTHSPLVLAGQTDTQQAALRPLEVPGPFGEPISMTDLPPPETRRWVVRRKAEVIAAITGGLISMTDACQRYRLSPEELELWCEAFERAGVPGLRVTRIQAYRDYPPPPARKEEPGTAHLCE